jgi:UDP-2-acetamido-2,6-beta-L-arabino-hexul-4-ose reductase
MAEPAKLDPLLSNVSAVLHLAGVNRAGDEGELLQNVSLARQLTESLERSQTRPHIVYANSIQSGSDSAFGRTKEAAADHFLAWQERTGGSVSDVRLPNLFGEHGRPHYNSVVATFCYLLATGGEPSIIEDRTVPLLHVQDAVDQMLELVDSREAGKLFPKGTTVKVSALLEKLVGFRDMYATGDIPDIRDRFDRALFNTYRSFCFPDHYPVYPALRSDARGDLFECVRGFGGQSLVFSSSTRPNVTRGQHFHLRKVERFLVLRGEATISLRRLFTDTVVRFDVTGSRPAAVDMPTMWAHSITNTGSDDLMTLFWADEIPLNGSVDTYAEPVELAARPA